MGIHPHDASTATDAVLDELAKLASAESVVAIGETGLDYYYDNSPRRAAAGLSPPDGAGKGPGSTGGNSSRDATQDTLEILKSLLLCGHYALFSGSWETAELCMNMGLYIAFGGAITFKNASRLRG